MHLHQLAVWPQLLLAFGAVAAADETGFDVLDYIDPLIGTVDGGKS